MRLNEFAMNRQQALSIVDSYVVEYSNHLIKCVVFGNSTGNLSHWSDEIAEYLDDINSIRMKPNNKKVRDDYLHDYFFLASGDSELDYRLVLKAFQKKSAYKYPDFEITSNLVKRAYNVFLDFADMFSPILSKNNSCDKEWFKNKILNYFE